MMMRKLLPFRCVDHRIGLMMAYVAAICLLGSAVCDAGQSVTVRNDRMYGRPVKVLENAHARVAVTPQIGGRVIDYRLRDEASDGRMLRGLYIARHNIHREPTDQWMGAEYGGLSDVATLDWPGFFWGLEYDLQQVSTEDGRPALRLSAEARGIGIERQVALEPESTMFTVRVRQTNTGSSTRPMVARLHGEFAVGEAADDNDAVYLMAPGGLKRINYRLGWENPRFSFEQPVEGWLAMVDEVQALALIRLFEPVDESIRVLLWHGHNEGGFGEDAARDELGGFYGIDRFMESVSVQPDKSITIGERFYLVDGLPRVDFVDDGTAGALVLDRQAYGPNQPVDCRVIIGGARRGGPFEVTLTWQPSDGEARSMRPIEVGVHEPGSVASASMEFSSGEGGRLVMQVRDGQGDRLAECSRRVVVDAVGYQRAVRCIDDAEKLAGKIDTLLMGGDFADAQAAAQRALVELWLDRLRQPTERGDFTAVADQSPSVMAHLEAVYQRLNGDLGENR